MQTQTGGSRGDNVPLYAPCRKLSIGDPFRWLKMGWQDFKRAPWHSLVYGLVFVFFGWLLLYFAWAHENNALIVSLLFGFLIMGPVLAFGLYDISHQLELNRKPTFRHERQKAFHEMGHELFACAMILGMMFVVLAIVVSMMMVGIEPTPGELTTTSAVSFSYAVAPLLIAVIFAGLIFCASAFALPMILHQDTDATTALINKHQCGVAKHAGFGALGVADLRTDGCRIRDRTDRSRVHNPSARLCHLARVP